MSEVIKDDAALWHDSRNTDIQDFEEPDFIQPEPDPESEEPKEYISDRDVKTELNMLKLNEPTAEIIVSLMNYLMIIPMSFVCRGISKEETKVDTEERETLVQAFAAYLKTTSFNMSPGAVLFTTILTIYGSKVVAFHFKNQSKPEPEFIEQEQEYEKKDRTNADSGS